MLINKTKLKRRCGMKSAICLNIPFDSFDKNFRERFNFTEQFTLIVSERDYELLHMYMRVDRSDFIGSLRVIWQPNEIVAPGRAVLTNEKLWRGRAD